MDVIPVDGYPFARTFPSIETAINHAIRYPPLARVKADEELLRGSQIVDGFWTDRDFVIRFSNGRFLHVWVAPREPDYFVRSRVLDEEPTLDSPALQRVGAEPVTLEFPRIGRDAMDRSAIFAARRGKDFREFFVNENAFFVYTVNQLILCFMCLYRRDNGENILYVYEDD